LLDAVANGGCVVCFQQAGPGHFLYCHEHDDGCDDDCPRRHDEREGGDGAWVRT
jgi:hypothetical protein